jgi:hypothetical protein
MSFHYSKQHKNYFDWFNNAIRKFLLAYMVLVVTVLFFVSWLGGTRGNSLDPIFPLVFGVAGVIMFRWNTDRHKRAFAKEWAEHHPSD